MPSPPHKCAHPGCTALVQRKEAKVCRKHHVKTPEHIAKIAAAITGKPKSAEHRRKLSVARTGSGTVNRRCVLCGAPFVTRKPSTRKQFCNRRCAGIWRFRNRKFRPTDIEVAFASAMDRRGWQYESQKCFHGTCVADFYIPSINAVVFCDGDYWHSLPDQQVRDARHNDRLSRTGHLVFRFLGSEIKRSVDACLDSIPYRTGTP